MVSSRRNLNSLLYKSILWVIRNHFWWKSFSLHRLFNSFGGSKNREATKNAKEIFDYFKKQALKIPKVKAIKGRGLMLGLEFDFPVAALRKELIYKHHIFTGNAKNPNLLRILPPLTIQKKHIDLFIEALKIEVS